ARRPTGPDLDPRPPGQRAAAVPRGVLLAGLPRRGHRQLSVRGEARRPPGPLHQHLRPGARRRRGAGARDRASAPGRRPRAVRGVGAFWLRVVVGKLRCPKLRNGLVIFGAYVEAVWIMLVVIRARHLPGDAWDGASDRKALHWFQDGKDAVDDRLGTIGK